MFSKSLPIIVLLMTFGLSHVTLTTVKLKSACDSNIISTNACSNNFYKNVTDLVNSSVEMIKQSDELSQASLLINAQLPLNDGFSLSKDSPNGLTILEERVNIFGDKALNSKHESDRIRMLDDELRSTTDDVKLQEMLFNDLELLNKEVLVNRTRLIQYFNAQVETIDKFEQLVNRFKNDVREIQQLHKQRRIDILRFEYQLIIHDLSKFIDLSGHLTILELDFLQKKKQVASLQQELERRCVGET